MDDRPRWAQRLTAEREARSWSQLDTVRAIRAHSSRPLPDDKNLLRSWKRWESGATQPDATYQALIATTFSTVAAAIWPVTGRGRGHSAELVEVTGLSTLDVITRLRASAVDQPTLDALRITADQLCTDYPHLPAEQLLIEGRAWLHRISSLLGAQMTLTQHREILVAAGWLALLVGCVEHDLGDRRAAEGTRQAALSLGMEAEHPEIQGWACEMLAWFDLTRGDYPGVIAASDEGIALAGDSSVSVQLFAQKAKAWARLGDRRMAWVALEEGRRLLERLSRPANIEHHFVVDPAKFDFYGMDVYSVLGENALAATYAGEVIHASTASDGTPRAPMRIAEALTTQGLVAAREGEIELAVSLGREALAGERKSLPSLLLVSRGLATLLDDRYPGEPAVRGYLDEIRALKAS